MSRFAASSRRAIAFRCVVLFAFVAASAARAADEDVLPPTLDASVARGLEFLATQQNADGSFGNAQKPAITGLAVMAFLASGHVPNSRKFDPNIGKYGSTLRDAIDYLLSEAQPDGSFGHTEKSMYGQGIVTLALAEAYGVESEPQRKRMAVVIANSVKRIIAAQNVQKQDVYAGGWRYEADAPDSDLSLSGWNALALRACRDVGVAVPNEAVARAVQFVMKCYSPEAKGFSYQPGTGILPSTTAVGILCLHLLDNGNRPEAVAAAKTLAQRPLDEGFQYAYYSLYYATQAAFQAGHGEWASVWKYASDRILKGQQSDGGWPDSGESTGAGRAYTTSMALLTLSVPYRLLPVYQR